MAETDESKTNDFESRSDRESNSSSSKSSSSSGGSHRLKNSRVKSSRVTESDRSIAGVRSKIKQEKKAKSNVSFSTKTSTVLAFDSKPMSSSGPRTNQPRQQKKVQITDKAMKSPKTPTRVTPRMTPDILACEVEPITSELHVVRNRKARSAPARSRQLFAQSSNLVYLQKECDKVERKMRQMAQANLATRPKIKPHTPFTWNSLAPYYNTDTLRYIIAMPIPVRRGYSSRVTASGMVDPAVSWKMDHCLAPVTPSRPEVFRQHYAKRRTKSAMPRVVYDNSILCPNYPKITEATYDVLAGSPRPQTSRSRRSNKA